MNEAFVIGVDIGGTKIRICSARPERPDRILYTITIPTARSFAQAQPDILQAIHILLEGAPVAAIGISSPGPVSRKKGTIGHPTNLHWSQARIVQWLTSLWDCPVALWNDAAAGGICEAQFGSARRHRYALYVSISTGIGTALTLDGWPLPGRHNSEGGRIHLGTDAASPTFEQISSGTAILKRYGRIARDITNKADWHDISARMAVGLHNLIVTTDPDIVVLGGGVSLHHARFLPSLKRELKLCRPMYALPPIVPATHIEHAPLIGAMRAALAEHYENLR